MLRYRKHKQREIKIKIFVNNPNQRSMDYIEIYLTLTKGVFFGEVGFSIAESQWLIPGGIEINLRDRSLATNVFSYAWFRDRIYDHMFRGQNYLSIMSYLVGLTKRVYLNRRNK